MTEHESKLEQAKAVQKKYTDMLMEKEHVVGVSLRPVEGFGNKPKEYAIVVMVDGAGKPDLPSQLDGVPLIVETSGVFQAQ